MSSSSFDPYTQNVTFIGPGGVPINATVDFIDMYIQYGVQSCANMGVQLGATIITLIVLLMLTQPGKRHSPVFILNTSALTSNIVWLVTSLVFFSTQWFEIYNIATGDFSDIPPGAYANGVIQCISENIMFACIYGSLVLQSNVIFTGARDLYRWIVLALTLTVSLVSYGFHLAQWVINMEDIMSTQPNDNFEWLENINTIMITVTICVFSAIFIVKLAYAIRRRRRLGVKRFGPMQAIFIMSCQTMILPAILSILQYFTDIANIDTNISTVVVVTLPLSALWSAATVDGRGSVSTQEFGTRRRLWHALSSTSASVSNSPSIAIQFQKSRRPGSVPRSNSIELSNKSVDLEKGKGVQVQQDISVD